MRKLAEETERLNVRLPKAIIDWLGAKARKHNCSLSDEVRYIFTETKIMDDACIKIINQRAECLKKDSADENE